MSAEEKSAPGQVAAEGDGGAEHEAFQEQTRAHRLTKLEALRERGIEPYPVRFDRDATAAALQDEFAELAAGTDTGKVVHLAGRVMAERRHGGLDFADLQDETGQIQLMATREAVGADELHEFSDLDLGDWVGVEGTVIASDHGELTVRVDRFELLSKSLRALPDVRHGVADAETRYRQRYLDLILDEPSRRTFAIRSSVIATTRRVLIERGFVEVETPVRLDQAGGGAAEALIPAPPANLSELPFRSARVVRQKRLSVGGMNGVLEMARFFRNGGPHTRH